MIILRQIWSIWMCGKLFPTSASALFTEISSSSQIYTIPHVQFLDFAQICEELGEIQKLNVGDGVDHFDAKTFPHYHFICKECGSVIDLQMENIDTIKDIAGVNFDGQIAGHITYFYGICGNCCKKTETSAN